MEIFYNVNIIKTLKEYQTHMYEHSSSSNRFRCNECPYNCKNYSKLKVRFQNKKIQLFHDNFIIIF